MVKQGPVNKKEDVVKTAELGIGGGTQDKLNYLDILVEMTLQFIRADHSDDFSLINNEKIDRL